MFKRLFTLLLIVMLVALSAGTVLAQAPFVSIVSPASGTVIPNGTLQVSATVQFGNAPEGGSSLLLRADDASETSTLTQVSTIDLSVIPWQATLDFTGVVPASGTPLHLIAYMLDSGGSMIATSPAIAVTYGNAVPPTATPTNPPPPPTSTPPGATPGITVISPPNGANVDPSAGVFVQGNTTNMPAGATVLVRLRNANGDTLGEQGVVPVANQPWSATVTKTVNVPTTGNGTLFAFLILNGNVVAQTDAIPLNYPGSSPQTTITINSPANGAVVPLSFPISVSGTTSGLPGGAKILVQAFVNGNPNPVGQHTFTPSSNNWSTSLNFSVSVANGTPGSLIAYVTSSNVAVATSNLVNVTWGGSNSGQPSIQITSPLTNSVVGVNSAPIPVFGTAINVFENNVTVRALDSFGNVLSQQSVTASNNNWQATLQVFNITPGTPGTLYAFATSPQNGSVVASAHVNVFYGGQCFVRADWPIYVVKTGDTLNKIAQKTGTSASQLAIANCLPNANLVYVGQQLHVPNVPVTPQPLPASILISTPPQNAQLNTAQPISVIGTGTNLIGNNIVVRALDSNGNLLAQQTTSPSAPNGSGVSTWQVSLNVVIQNTLPGTIYAFVQVPSNGTVLADALVNVTFVSPIQKTLIITQPTSNASVPPSGQLPVNGQVIGPIDGDVFVRVLDNQGNVLAEVQATLSPPDNQGNSTWQALLNINVPPGTRGTLFAYIPSPFGANGLIADSVNVVFGQPGNTPYVTVTSPMPYAILDTTAPISISGRGGRLFEGSLVVRALDSQGNVLAESPTTINSPNAGTGGEGDWQVSLPVNVAPGTRGSIVAFSTNAQNGGIAAFASIYVTYGDPTATTNFVRINAPLPGTIVDPSQTLAIAGTADRKNSNSVKVQIVDDQGNVLVEQPRNLNPSPDGNFGVWQLLVELKSMAPGTHLRINALTISKFDGTTLATDSIDIIVGASSQAQGS